MTCKYCDNEMKVVNMELSNSTIADPKFHFFHQCFGCGWSDKKWFKADPQTRKMSVPFHEDIYDEWRRLYR